MRFVTSTIVILLAAPIFGSGVPEIAKPVTVHEWGTFTTVAAQDGSEAAWEPLGTASDLPCFVFHLNGLSFKSIAGLPTTPITKPVTVRMETPVLYFYTPQKTRLSVAVDFPHGLITEWYPRAAVLPEMHSLAMPPVEHGHIAWGPVEIDPEAKPTLPRGNSASPYYAARNTDSAPVRFDADSEKLLFYRGIGNFDVPVAARISENGAVDLRNTGDAPLPLAVLYENRDGHMGYRILNDVQGSRQIAAPELTGNLPALKRDLAAALIGQGLYAKEADAMVATWSDSWFEEGMRVFYLVPRGVVDRELPLTITPSPKTIQRVFVGRLELLSPSRHDRLATALAAGDTRTLDTFGRFLAPFMQQLKVDAAPAVANYLDAKVKAANREFLAPSCAQ